MGFLGIAVPENYGGLGLGFVSTMIACDYISGATGSLATAYAESHTELARFLSHCTEPKLKSKIFTRFSSWNEVWSILFNRARCWF